MTQTDALTILKTGASIFLTGNAGSGKTYLLNEYINWLKASGIGHAVTASTGIAATHLGGQTIHSFCGIGVRKTLSPYDLEELAERKYLHDRFSKLRVLIVDEISMLHSETLDLVDQVCRLFKDAEKPFGGLQVILSGDFFQLPPIDRNRDSLNVSIFAYQSKSWQALNPIICYLTEQHRQQEEELLNILNSIRGSQVDQQVVSLLSSKIKDQIVSAEITRLFAHNEDIDSVNRQELDNISGSAYSYDMTFKGKGSLTESLKKSVLAPEKLWLKPGALVMCVKNNYDKGYVNGTLGTVVSCDADAPVVLTKTGKTIKIYPESWVIEENGKIKAEVIQVPLRLAWAITIHKSQGMSLDSAVVDLSRSFVYGMGYVALSRLRTFKGLYLQGFNEMALKVHPEIAEVDGFFAEQSTLAERAIGSLTPDTILDRQQNFVKKSGGIWPTEKDLSIAKVKEPKNLPTRVSTEVETVRLLEEGKTIKQIAKHRKLTEGTILSHLEKAKNKGIDLKLDHLKLATKKMADIHKAFMVSKSTALSPVKCILTKKGLDYSFEDIRLARLFLDLS